MVPVLLQEARKNKLLDVGQQGKPRGGREETITPESTSIKADDSGDKHSPPPTAPKPSKRVTPAAPGLNRSVSAVTETEMDFTELVKQASEKGEQVKVEEEEQKADFEVFMHHTKRTASIEASARQAWYGTTLSNLNKVLHNMAASMTTED